MKWRILAVGDDPMLLSTRVSVLNIRWSAKAISTSEALDTLREGQFDALVLCHSIPIGEARSLVETIRKDFPALPILALETSPGFAADLDVDATAVTTNGPSQMLGEIENLLRSSHGGGR